MYNVNPAYAGKNDKINVFIDAQSQNRGVSYANKNFVLGAYSGFSSKQALGARLISDTRGAFQILKADISYAYVAKLTREQNLIFGLNAGIQNSSLTINRIENHEYIDMSDPTIVNNTFNTTQFSTGFGFLYQFKSLEVSVAMPHIISTTQPLNSYFHGAAFYTFDLKNKFKVTPWFSFQQIPTTKNVLSIYTKAEYNELVWIQAGYQSGNSLLASLGTNIDQISLAYGFRYNNKAFSNVATGSHEVLFSFKFDKKTRSNGLSSHNDDLANVISKLDGLIRDGITKENKARVIEQLEKIKQELKKVEYDNSTPEKAQEVEKQLLEIDSKLKLIEEQLSKNE
jgi:type IX secretion system PorP/SprF family membrane protein